MLQDGSAPAAAPAPPAALSLSEAVAAFQRRLRGPPDTRKQFGLALCLAALCGCINKLQLFPMNSIAGPSACVETLLATDVAFQPALKALACGPLGAPAEGSDDALEYAVAAVAAAQPGCEERVDFVVDSYVVRSEYLVHFGLVKAIMNFVTGVLADRYGRRTTMLIGWIAALPMPLLVLWADSWAAVSATNLLLGLQQAICWSTSIFIMLDYAGKENGGLAVGLNETSGYVALALMNVVAPFLLVENDPRGGCYYAVFALLVMGTVASATALKDTTHLLTGPAKDSVATPVAQQRSDEVGDGGGAATITGGCVIELPNGAREQVNVSVFAFVYTSFVKPKLIVINLAGLTVNFIAAMAWGLLLQWQAHKQFPPQLDTQGCFLRDSLCFRLKRGAAAGEGSWEALDTASVASIALAYDLTKGLGQFGCGFLGDRLGRKPFIVGGLSFCSLSLVLMSVVGSSASSAGTVQVWFTVGAFGLGLGTTMMYSNLLAAVADEVDASWRASALGTYRFWRDSGYFIGAMLSGAMADAFGIAGTVLVVAVLVAGTTTLVHLFYPAKPRA